MDIHFKETTKDKEYWSDYMKRRGYITPKIDAQRTSIGDLRVFCAILFPLNPRKSELAEAILREMSRLKTDRVELHRDIAPRIIKQKKALLHSHPKSNMASHDTRRPAEQSQKK